MTRICGGGPETLEIADGYWAGREAGLQTGGRARGGLVMADRNDGPAVDWGAVADPILATPPWRPRTRGHPVIAEAAADPHEHDWAGPGFTKPGPEPDVSTARYALGKPRPS